MQPRQLLNEKPFWLLVALVIGAFHRPITSETFCFRDLYQLFYH